MWSRDGVGDWKRAVASTWRGPRVLALPLDGRRSLISSSWRTFERGWLFGDGERVCDPVGDTPHQSGPQRDDDRGRAADRSSSSSEESLEATFPRCRTWLFFEAGTLATPRWVARIHAGNPNSIRLSASSLSESTAIYSSQDTLKFFSEYTSI